MPGTDFYVGNRDKKSPGGSDHQDHSRPGRTYQDNLKDTRYATHVGTIQMGAIPESRYFSGGFRETWGKSGARWAGSISSRPFWPKLAARHAMPGEERIPPARTVAYLRTGDGDRHRGWDNCHSLKINHGRFESDECPAAAWNMPADIRIYPTSNLFFLTSGPGIPQGAFVKIRPTTPGTQRQKIPAGQAPGTRARSIFLSARCSIRCWAGYPVDLAGPMCRSAWRDRFGDLDPEAQGVPAPEVDYRPGKR